MEVGLRPVGQHGNERVLMGDEEGDAELVRAAKHDPRVFAALYTKYLPAVFGYVRSRTGNRADAEDLTAEVFHRALRGLATFREGEGTFRAWLFRIAHNDVVDYFRARRPTTTLEEAEWLMGTADAADPQLLAVRSEEVRRLEQVLHELPAESREIIALRMAGGLRYAEIAAVTGLSEDAVKMRFHRAIRALRARWQDDG